MVAALNVPAEDGRRRMRTLRRQVLTHDVDRWARSFLEALGLPAAEQGEAKT
jgi:trehalose 6-phosphate synthase